MTLKRYLIAPVGLDKSEIIDGWLASAEEQGGLHSKQEDAEEDLKEYEGKAGTFKIYTLTISID